MKAVIATILLLAVVSVAISLAAAHPGNKKAFVKHSLQRNMTKPHGGHKPVNQHVGVNAGKAEDCDYVKCGEAIINCATKCGRDIASSDCIECLGPLYESCKSCF